jgi:zinc transport system substrate-binding protein
MQAIFERKKVRLEACSRIEGFAKPRVALCCPAKRFPPGQSTLPQLTGGTIPKPGGDGYGVTRALVQGHEARMKTPGLAALLLVTVLLCGCVSPNETPSGQVRAVVSIAPLGEFVREVGGERVQVTVLVPPGAEPHTFELSPSQVKEVAGADLYVQNGAGLEFWMDSLLSVNDKMLVVDSSEGLSLLSDDGEADPHIWLSLRNAEQQVKNICAGLVKLDPAGRDAYLRNRDRYLFRLKELDQELNQTFAGAERRIFIVHHPAWTYFARDYSLEQVPLMQGEKEPGPRHLREVVELGRKNNITVVFVEPEFNPKAAEVIAREMNASIVYLDPLAANYLENLRGAGDKIAESLR